jgi:endonuclease/exonuclease/phosphatase family metal-dependent hydrolase
MTWNVRYFSNRASGLYSTREGVEEVAKAILEVKPAVVGLQELEQESLRSRSHLPQAEQLQQALPGYMVYYQPAHRYEVGSVPIYTTGLAILVAKHLEAEDPAWSDITHRRFARLAALKQTRVAQALTVKTPSDSFIFCNTHLSLPSFLTRDLLKLRQKMGHGENQVKEAEKLVEFINQQPQKPCIVVGDFNSEPDTPAYQVLIEAGFKDAFQPFGHPGWATQGLGKTTLHLDHVFSRGISWLDFAQSHSWGSGRFQDISDHLPKIGRMTIG